MGGSPEVLQMSAAVWKSSSADAGQELNITGLPRSHVVAADGVRAVGYGAGTATGGDGFRNYRHSPGRIVGRGLPSNTGPTHVLLWNLNDLFSYVDLTPYFPNPLRLC